MIVDGCRGSSHPIAEAVAVVDPDPIVTAFSAIDLVGQEQLLLGQEISVQVAIPGARPAILAAVPAVAPLLEQVLALDRRLERPEDGRCGAGL